MKSNAKIILVVSLLLNVLLVGVIIGKMSHHVGHRWMHQSASELQPEQKAKIKGLFKSMRNQNEDLRKQMRATHREMFKALKADNFDADAYLGNANRLNAIKAEMMTNMSQTIATNAKDFSPEERKALARMMKHRKGHWCKKKRK